MGEAEETWGVVGGGILGLTLAYRLAQHGKKVTLFEAGKQLGGLASAWNLGSFVWDRHYHVTLLSDTRTRALLTELGLEREMQWVPSRSACFANGRLHSISSAIDLLRFPLLGWTDKARLGATILHGARIRDGKKLEQVSVADWLLRWSGRRTFERFWLPLLRSKLGETYKDTSAAFIWATIARLYAARRTGLKQELFGYLPGGYARTLDRFAEVAEQAGVSIQYERPIQNIQPHAGRLRVQSPGDARDLDRVVVTTPASIAKHICPALSADEHRRLQAVRYLGIVCASVVLRRPLADYYVTNLLDDGLPFTGVIEMSALVDPKHFAGHSLVYLPRYLAPEDPFFEASDAAIENEFLGALEVMYPRFSKEDVLCFKVSRARHVFALATLGYSDHLPPMVTSTPGLFLANSAHIVNATLNVNETLLLADRAFDTILGGRA